MTYLAETIATPAAPECTGRVALDDLFLTTNLPTTGGSAMLEGYKSLFCSDAETRLKAAGYAITGKVHTGEWGADLLGETCFTGADTDAAGNLRTLGTELLDPAAAAPVDAVVCFDVNGTPRRAAACSGIAALKPSYGLISRFGTIAVACSGEAVSVLAATPGAIRPVFKALVGHSNSDGTSLPETVCAAVADAVADAVAAPAEAPAPAAVKRVVVARGLFEAAGSDVNAALEAALANLAAAGIEIAYTDAEADQILAAARPAWNILMAAELCNNVSRFDGVKYGHRSADFMTIGELYTNSRTEGFGDLAKDLILFGSEVLADDNYFPMYDKSLRIRRKVCETFARLFAGQDGAPDGTAVLMPACSRLGFTPADVAADPALALTENLFTAPASITGLPAVVFRGLQLVGPACTDPALLNLAERL